VLDRLLAAARELGALAEAGGARFRLDIIGHTDEDGDAEANLPLSASRAEVVRAALASVDGGALDLAVSGVGSAQPAVEGRTEAEKQMNRRVTVRVTRL
jgi:OOP family OmpA-OmpF porin